MSKAKKLRFLLIIAIIFLVIILNSCSLLGKSKKSMASWEGSVFTSEWAGIRIPLPEGWQIATNEQIRQLTSLSTELVSGVTGVKVKDMEKADVIYPMYITEYPLGYDGLNTNMLLCFQKLKAIENVTIKDAKEFLLAVKKQLDNTNLGYNIEVGQTKNIAGKEFILMTSTINLVPGYEMIQKYYSCIHDGYIISIIATASIDQEEKIDSLVDRIESY